MSFTKRDLAAPIHDRGPMWVRVTSNPSFVNSDNNFSREIDFEILRGTMTMLSPNIHNKTDVSLCKPALSVAFSPAFTNAERDASSLNPDCFENASAEARSSPHLDLSKSHPTSGPSVLFPPL